MATTQDEKDLVALLTELGADGTILVQKLLETYQLGKQAGEIIGQKQGFDQGVAAARKQIASEIAGVKVELESMETPVFPMDASIECFGFDNHLHNCLLRGDIYTVGDLVSKTSQDLLDLRQLGQKRLTVVVSALSRAGYKLKPDTPFVLTPVLMS